MTPISWSTQCAKTGPTSNPCFVKLGLLAAVSWSSVWEEVTGFYHLPFNYSKQTNPFQYSQLFNIEKKSLGKKSGNPVLELQLQDTNPLIFPLITNIHLLEHFSGTNVETHVNSSLTSHNLTVCKCQKKTRQSQLMRHIFTRYWERSLMWAEVIDCASVILPVSFPQAPGK